MNHTAAKRPTLVVLDEPKPIPDLKPKICACPKGVCKMEDVILNLGVVKDIPLENGDTVPILSQCMIEADKAGIIFSGTTDDHKEVRILCR